MAHFIIRPRGCDGSQPLDITEPKNEEGHARDMTQTRVVINNLLNKGLALNIVKLGKNMLIINTGSRHYEGGWEGEWEGEKMTNLALAPTLEA